VLILGKKIDAEDMKLGSAESRNQNKEEALAHIKDLKAEMKDNTNRLVSCMHTDLHR
jgi:hypothetical protein